LEYARSIARPCILTGILAGTIKQLRRGIFEADERLDQRLECGTATNQTLVPTITHTVQFQQQYLKSHQTNTVARRQASSFHFSTPGTPIAEIAGKASGHR
jgi:hypothetical protein